LFLLIQHNSIFTEKEIENNETQVQKQSACFIPNNSNTPFDSLHRHIKRHS